jgi:hypothetical protein
MQKITKHFDSNRQAENYLQRLYDIYNYVRLINWPAFSQSGSYTFLVQD